MKSRDRPPKREDQRPRTPRRSDKPAGNAVARIAGLPAVAALFAAAPERVERLFFVERLRSAATPFCAALARERKPYRLVESDELDRVAGTVLHGGIVAIARPQAMHTFDAEAASDWARDGTPLLILDGIGNPHNLGAIARTAAFFGLRRMLLSDHPAQASPSDAAYRVSEGGLDQLELHRAVRLPEALKRLKPHYRVVATALGPHRVLGTLVRGDKPFALVLGNEEAGLPKATLAACDDIVVIPGSGRIQSLNVAASAAILLYTVAASHSASR
jgi:TrmH RNA methyltransferase